MTTRNLEALFEPKSIALVGASNRAGSVGAVLARNLLSAGFDGPIMAVNPHERSIRSTLSYRSVAELPVDPDLAVIATPPPAVPGLIAELGARGCRAAIVITAGFGEGDRVEGRRLQQAMLGAARPGLLRILGPNCLGFLSPRRKLNASFAHLTPKEGDVAFLTQSGAVATAVLDWAAGRDIGFSHVISLGGAADIDFGDLLDYLALDAATRSIFLYVESVSDARKFLTAGRIAARTKPVMVIKAGRSGAGARAAHSHTGAMAGADAVYDAAFRRAGMLRLHALSELFAAVETLGSGFRIAGDRLAILTNGGGLGVIAADALAAEGGRLAELSPETIAGLDTILPPAWSRGNPVDILGDADGARYGRTLEHLVEDPGQDAVLAIHCPTAVADSLEAAEAVAGSIERSKRPVLTSWTGDGAAAASRRLFAAKRLPTYETPELAVRAFMQLVAYRRHQELLLETPPAVALAPIDREAVAAIIAVAADEGRAILTEVEAKAILSACGIPVVAVSVAADPADAADKAAAIAGPKVLKILSPDITHKSDVGGVKLGLADAEAVRAAAEAMVAEVGRRAPAARIAGFTVQEMVERPHAEELIAGLGADPTFGPVVLFGQGGVAAEIIGDRAVGLPPLNLALARHLIASTRAAKLLAGYRDRPRADIDAIAAVLVQLAEIAVQVPEIAELDINPLLADERGVVALDARIVIGRPELRQRLSIRPYPVELERSVALSSGATAHLRPIRPEDEPWLVDLLDRSTAEDRRLRFLTPVSVVPHTMAARLTQIDYDREMAFVAFDRRGPAATMTGVARLIADPENERAEFAVMVRSDWKGRGLGFALMEAILDHARERGLGFIYGDVLAENAAMLKMAEELGFRVERRAEDRSLVRVTLDLEAGAVSKPGGLPPADSHKRA